MKKRSEEGMAPRVEWAGFARKKGLDSHSLHLTLTGHAIFVKKKKIRVALFAHQKGFVSPSIYLTHTPCN